MNGFWGLWGQTGSPPLTKDFSNYENLQVSMALIAPKISAWSALPKPVFSPKQSKKSELLSLKIPPQEDWLLFVDPSVLHFIQFGDSGIQITSITWGAQGGCSFTLNFLNIKLVTSRVALQGIFVFWNLSWFLAYQTPLKMLIRVATRTILHCGFQELLHKSQTSSLVWKLRVQLIVPTNHLHKLRTYVHSKNRWKDDSTVELHREHIDGRWKPLDNKHGYLF